MMLYKDDDYRAIVTDMIFCARDEVSRYLKWTQNKPRYHVWINQVLP